MSTNWKNSGMTKSILEGALEGTLTSASISGAILLILSEMLMKEKITYEKVMYILGAGVMLSGFLGSRVSWKATKRRKMVSCILPGAIFIGLLLAAAIVFFEVDWDRVGVTAAYILGGSICAAAISGATKSGHKRIRR